MFTHLKRGGSIGSFCISTMRITLCLAPELKATPCWDGVYLWERKSGRRGHTQTKSLITFSFISGSLPHQQSFARQPNTTIVVYRVHTSLSVTARIWLKLLMHHKNKKFNQSYVIIGFFVQLSKLKISYQPWFSWAIFDRPTLIKYCTSKFELVLIQYTPDVLRRSLFVCSSYRHGSSNLLRHLLVQRTAGLLRQLQKKTQNDDHI